MGIHLDLLKVIFFTCSTIPRSTQMVGTGLFARPKLGSLGKGT